MSSMLLARRALLATALTVATALGATAPADASHPQAPRDISKLDYSGEGFFKHGDPIPAPDEAPAFFAPMLDGKKFNPPGENKYHPYDTNVFETLMLPFRAASDTTSNDPYGNGGDPRHGYCKAVTPAEQQAQRPGNTALMSGVCPNHANEYMDYYEATMQDILGEFGVEMKRYEFRVPDVLEEDRLPTDNTLSGRTHNIAAIVPGAGHADEHIVIGAHYDQTNDGPASVWDSAEGHAQIIRVAKQMADYWKATNTRPTATVKFIPWAGEEAGVLGSADYAENNIVPGEEGKVRGYWNTDPCAGGYPAFRYGNPADRVALGIQLARPTEVPDEFGKLRPRVTAFNAAAEGVVEEVLTRVDDDVPVVGGEEPTFISKSEDPANYDYRAGGDITIGSSRPVLFSSDWRSFLAKGIPFFNPGPEITGPSDENEPNSPEGAATFHTPNDNHVTLGRFTGQPLNVAIVGDAFASAGWSKGMEFCASMLSWGMLRDDQGGAETVQTGVVAYYEALPNEAKVRAPVTFDADGSHELTSTVGTRTPSDANLEYIWDFGDGTKGSGEQVQHAYDFAGVYKSTLTVRNTQSGVSDTMTVPITVKGTNIAGPSIESPAEDEDGFYDVKWTFDQSKLPGFAQYILEEATQFARVFTDPAENLAAGWTASEPTEESIQKWQHSDENNGSVRGNVKHQGARSFYTGISRSDQKFRAGPSSGVSRLTLKQSFPLSSDAELTYRSSFRNDTNDSGLVEVGIDPGGVGDDEIDWQVVDSVKTTENYGATAQDSSDKKQMELRRVDLGAFAGQRVKIRFVYTLGPAFFVNVSRTGWYVDDMAVDTGNFREIARTADTTAKIGPRRKGTYAYRVRAVGEKDSTLPSNFARTNVTVGTDPDAAPKGVVSDGLLPGRAPTCTVDTGFKSLKVTPSGRGLRFDFERSVRGAVRVDVFRYYQSKKRIGRRAVAKFRDKTKSFTWSGRGKRVRNGSLYARISIPVGRQSDVRYVSLQRSKGRFTVKRAFRSRPSCGALQRFHLGQMVFGGRKREGLRVIYRVAKPGTVRIELLRGSKVVKRTAARRIARAGTYQSVIAAKGLRRGEYRVRIIAVLDGERVTSTLAARRI